MSRDDYPSEEELARIEAWPMEDLDGCLDFVKSIWHWGEDWCNERVSPAEREVIHAEDGARFLRCATGGWSGNESIIGAMESNRMLLTLCWRLTASGGLHIWEYRKP